MPTAAINGTELFYKVDGSGEPIVLIPGSAARMLISARWFRCFPRTTR
jgi:hypothetical protein